MANKFDIIVNDDEEKIVIEDYGAFNSNLKIISPYYKEYMEQNVFSKFGRIYKCNRFNDNSENLINFTGRTCEVIRGNFNSMWDTFTVNDKGAHLLIRYDILYCYIGTQFIDLGDKKLISKSQNSLYYYRGQKTCTGTDYVIVNVPKNML
jgi:hypothetical protein